MLNNANDNGGLIVAYSQDNNAYVVSAPRIGWYTVFRYATMMFTFHLDADTYDVLVAKSSQNHKCPTTPKAAQKIADNYSKHFGDESAIMLDGDVDIPKNSPDLKMSTCIGHETDLTTFAKAACFAQRCFLAIYKQIHKRNLNASITETKSELKLNAQQASKLQTKLKHLQARRKD